MSAAPTRSPVASLKPGAPESRQASPSPGRSVVSSSDWGEREDKKVKVEGDNYWKQTVAAQAEAVTTSERDEGWVNSFALTQRSTSPPPARPSRRSGSPAEALSRQRSPQRLALSRLASPSLATHTSPAPLPISPSTACRLSSPELESMDLDEVVLAPLLPVRRSPSPMAWDVFADVGQGGGGGEGSQDGEPMLFGSQRAVDAEGRVGEEVEGVYATHPSQEAQVELQPELEEPSTKEDLLSQPRLLPEVASQASTTLSSPVIPPRRLPAATLSPTPSVQPSTHTPPSSPPVIIPPDPDPLPAGRSMRQRTAAQLNPYSREQALYQQTLLKNGWRGAVVAGPKAKEMSTEELKRRKAEQLAKERDDLDGWLVVPVAKRPEEDETSQSEEDEERGSDDSLDGLDLLQREETRKRRVEREVRRAMGTANVGGRGEGPSWDLPAPRTDGSTSTAATTFRKPKQRARRATSVIESDSNSLRRSHPSKKSRNATASDDESSRSRSRAQARTNATASSARRREERGQSAPLSSSPAKAPRRQRSAKEKERRAKEKMRGLTVLGGNRPPPSKEIHARGARDDGGLDADLLEVEPSSHSDSDVRIFTDGGGSDEEDQSQSQSQSSDRSISPVAELAARPDRFKVKGKRKKALRAMMPGSFMKKAVKDLELMKREKALGYASGSDFGSGDEEAEEERKGRGRMRTVPRLRDEPINFSGEAFTDESDSEGRVLEPSSVDDESEEEDDAVHSWLNRFAPQRKKGTEGRDGRDVIDRYLQQSKRLKKPSKSWRRTKTGAKGDGARTKQKEGRPPLAEASNGRSKATSGPSKGALRSRTTRAPKRVVPLDTDDAIFAFSRDIGGDFECDEVDINLTEDRPAPPRAAPASQSMTTTSAVLPPGPAAPSVTDDSERWAAFGKFSHDFAISRLPSGISFPATSFVKKGHVFSLVNPDNEPVQYRSCEAFGVHLDSTMATNELEAALPALCDAVFDASETLLFAEGEQTVEAADGAEQVGQMMRFLGAYASQVVVPQGASACDAFEGVTGAQFDRLEARLDAMVAKELARQTRPFTDHRLRLSWYLIDIAVRLDLDRSHSTRINALLASLVRKLVRHGCEHTTKVLKRFMDALVPERRVIDDASVECWVGLICLALAPSYARFDAADLWQLATCSALGSISPRAKRGPAPGEVLSYMGFMLCALSQFSPSGVSTFKPRLEAHWPVLMHALDQIQPAALAKADHTVSNTALMRRDKYIFTLFARCVTFVNRWGWSLEGGRGELLPKLFELLNARRLADLSIENRAEFPPFLQQLDKLEGEIKLDNNVDTAFVVFLKLVVLAARSIEAKSELDKRRQLTKLFLRLTPLSAGPWTRTSAELAPGKPSILVNHLSLYLTFGALHPASLNQRLDQIRRLVVFEEAEMEARRTTLRAGMHFALICKREGAPLAGVIDWLASVMLLLKAEFERGEKRSRMEERGRKAKDQPLFQVAVSVAMVLRSVQLTLKARMKDDHGPNPYPDAKLLHPAWTTAVLDSSLGLDPVIGTEVVATINCFLDLRQAALPRAVVAAVEDYRASQDEFGMFEIDYEDPALNALLGVVDSQPAPATPQADHTASAKEAEKSFAQLVQNEISPAFFRLVSSIYLPSNIPGSTGPTAADRARYAHEVVSCWTRCLTVLIENDLAEWTGYLQYGNHSWRRVSDPLGKRVIGMLLAVQMLRHDPGLGGVYADELVEIWVQAIVARECGAQWTFTKLLVDAERPSVLLEGVKGVMGEDEGWFVEGGRRLEVVLAFLTNAAKALRLAGAPPTFLALGGTRSGQPQKSTVLNLLRSLLAAMRDNLAVLSKGSGARAEYAAFVREVVAGLRERRVAETGLADLKILDSMVEGA